MKNKRYNKSNKSLENNFKQNKSQSSFNVETGVINNPNITAAYSDDKYGVNFISLALNNNGYIPLGSHEGNGTFLNSILTPSFTQAAQLVSNYKVNVTSGGLQNYFNRVASAMGVIMTCRQINAYVKESGTINPAVYEIYKRVFDGETLQNINILEQCIMQHYLPPRFLRDLVDHYTWRQSGKTAFSGIIGNVGVDLDSISTDIKYQLSKFDELISGGDSIYPVMAKISLKSDIDWSIRSLPEMSGTLNYDEEFTSRFINTPILQSCGDVKQMCTSVNTTNYGSLVAEPSVISVLTCPYYKTTSTRPYIGFIDPRLRSKGGFGIIVSNKANSMPSELGKDSNSYYNEIFSALGRQTTVVSDHKKPVISRMSLPGCMVIQNINETSLDVLYTKYMNYLFEVPNITRIN